MRSTRPKPTSRTSTQHVRLVREQPVQAVGRDPHRHRVETPPALVALQHRSAAGIESEPHRIGDCLGQRRHIAQPHVQSLPGNGVNDMRRVADQRDAFGDEAARNRQPERIGAARTRKRDLAEMQSKALFGFGEKIGVGQRHEPVRLARFLGPHDGGALALERQDRERPRRQEMLLGAAVMIALMRDGRDDARLSVGPAVARDPRAFANSASARRPPPPAAARR